ncbi:GNAT family protein [Olsenella sp. kh2p3]|uniref:GNAT family N-acetyltransferase n=1 Tax=Olsenella sp. kh2p3 TaxID=1797112 RepID=UPI0009246C1A|nr:GNAT family protein [Olsenella sp. kh2p3]SFX55537.1 Protein N-acetyltransferase, RimJ/RimL family [Olsenella sp. kh2p3]
MISRNDSGYILRPSLPEDAQNYARLFDQVNPEVARLTGSALHYDCDEVVSFFLANIDDETRRDFLLLDPTSRIIGESVINEIDSKLRSANFRIGIFDTSSLGCGIGSWAIEQTIDFAFREIGLHRLSLDVFSFNPRAIRAYEKAGFVREGALRDAVIDSATGSYGDDILMSILESEWREHR